MIKKVIFKKCLYYIENQGYNLYTLYRGEESRPSLFDQ